VVLLLVVFDLEGTLLGAEFFPALGRRLGLGDTLAGLTDKAMNGEMGFEESLAARFEALRGLPMEFVEETCAKLPLNRGARKAVATLKEHGFVPAIISGGFEILADHFAAVLGIEIVCANRLVVSRGRIAGIRKPILTPQLKADLLVNIAGQLGFGTEECVAVGDGAIDVHMLEAAGLGIAFNGKSCVREAANVAVDSGDLKDVVPHILDFRSSLKGDGEDEGKLVRLIA